MIRSRRVDGVNGLSMHILEAGDARAPCVLLLHGFPELAYSWRKIMPALAQAGFYAIAPDQRGYGETTGWDVRDLDSFALGNIARDATWLLQKLGIEKAHLVGHDFGSFAAGAAALLYPERFRTVTFMSAPFGGGKTTDPSAELARLVPPRKHYQWYYSTPHADADMRECPQGVHAFLRAYYHMKSADWPANTPHPLADNSAAEMAKLPRYYVMDIEKGMAESVAGEMPTREQVTACKWLTDEELRVYSGEYGRTGFQGGLQSYRVGRVPRLAAELQLFAGRTLDVPSLFLSGKSDWGVYQRAGSLDAMKRGCTKFDGVELIEGAGHWVQQEKAAAVAERLITFARAKTPASA